MKVKSILFTALSFLFTSLQAQHIKGSDTMLPVARQTAERFMHKYDDVHVTVTGGGTGTGIAALMDHTIDIAMASRPIKPGEKMKARSAGINIEEIIIAYDALAVVVHPSNPVQRLTRNQLEDIFRGKITNWNQLGGENRKIIVYSRESTSGTYEFFKENVLKNKNYLPGRLTMSATDAVIQSVSRTKGAIGYVGLAYLSAHVKTLSVSYDEDGRYTLPSIENAINKTYPIVRPLYYYYKVENKDAVAPLLRFILSTEGQDIIKKSGYIPVK